MLINFLLSIKLNKAPKCSYITLLYIPPHILLLLFIVIIAACLWCIENVEVCCSNPKDKHLLSSGQVYQIGSDTLLILIYDDYMMMIDE